MLGKFGQIRAAATTRKFPAQGSCCNFAQRLAGQQVNPGHGDLDGTICACTGMAQHVDGNHAHTCKVSGRISVHNKVRDALARAIQIHGGAQARWHRTEVRGDNLSLYYPKGDKRGPDIAGTVNGVATFFGVTGVANMSTTHQQHFRRADKAVIQHKMTLGATTTPRSDARHVETPLDKRHDTKRNSGGAGLAAANDATLAPCVFAYNGGIHKGFDKILIKMFARARAQHVFAFPDDIRGTLHVCAWLPSTCCAMPHKPSRR